MPLTLEFEAEPDALVELHRMIEELNDSSIDVQPRTKQPMPGQLSEPITIALIVALGGPVVTQELGKVLRRWMTHRERMAIIRAHTANGTIEVIDLKGLAELN